VALEIIWGWAKEAEINPDELLLAKNDRGERALDVASKKNYVAILETLCVWAEEAKLNPNEAKNKLLLAKDKYGNITWHRAARFGRLKTFWGRLRK
jgi:hypothetical protein